MTACFAWVLWWLALDGPKADLLLQQAIRRADQRLERVDRILRMIGGLTPPAAPMRPMKR
jgi:hypothetical protein